MKYLVVGAGGTGGCIGAFMTEAGKDVTLIARGEHLKRMREHGLVMETTLKGNFVVNPIKATDMEHYNDRPDVVFVCVKGYSLPETVPFLRRICDAHTIVIPCGNFPVFRRREHAAFIATRLPPALMKKRHPMAENR